MHNGVDRSVCAGRRTFSRNPYVPFVSSEAAQELRPVHCKRFPACRNTFSIDLVIIGRLEGLITGEMRRR